jgi:hypothetical protein
MLYRLNHRHDDDHDDHGGLHRDLTATGSAMARREVLRRFTFGAGALALFGCGSAGTGVLAGADTTIDTGSGTSSNSTCSKIPSETAGPFPGDGSNGANVLDRTGVVRSDIRSKIYPGCYSGRWPHIHFEVHPTLASSTSVSNRIATSQIALPKAANDLVYAASGYGDSASNATQITLASDGIFSDGASLELATVAGSVSKGFVSSLTVAV